MVGDKRKQKIMLTGASGFIGNALRDRLKADGVTYRCAIRKHSPDKDAIPVGGIGPHTQWAKALHGVDSVIHTAARAHIMSDEVPNPLSGYRKVNVEGTLNLASQAAEAGSKRFIFISSIKVNGEQTYPNHPFSEKNVAHPEDPYGVSKHEAEEGLRLIAEQTGMEVVIIRPPLVYGPGVKGNFATLIGLLQKGLPLPLGKTHNIRSLIALDNLVDFIITCIDHPAAANQTFLVSDGEDLSTTKLLRKIAKAYGINSFLLPVPIGLMRLVAKLLGKGAVADRLFGNLQVDSSKARDLLGWKPVVTMDEQLRKMAEGDLMQRRRGRGEKS